MSVRKERYDSGLLLRPISDEDRWIEVQRILADIMDQATLDEKTTDSYKFFGDDVSVAETTWTNRKGETNDLIVSQYSRATESGVRTWYHLACVEAGGKGTTDYVVTETLFDTSPPNMRRITKEELDSRLPIYNILATVALSGVAEETHAQFEVIVTATAIDEVMLEIDERDEIMNWSVEDWDRAIAARHRMFERHRQWRVHPMYLSRAALNAMSQGQLPMPPEAESSGPDAILSI